jgi:hypothetical protein
MERVYGYPYTWKRTNSISFIYLHEEEHLCRIERIFILLTLTIFVDNYNCVLTIKRFSCVDTH